MITTMTTIIPMLKVNLDIQAATAQDVVDLLADASPAIKVCSESALKGIKPTFGALETVHGKLSFNITL